jgi:UDP-N-acetylmuramate--alanine ligase
MSALARYFNRQGHVVAGYDRTQTPLTSQLVDEGMLVHYADHVSLIPGGFDDPEITLVVYTPAIPGDHAEMNFFKQKGFTMLKRAEVLGLVSKDMHGMAMAGTHGKTTTSTLAAHLLMQAGQGCYAFLGGIAKNYGQNYLYTENSDLMVLEADEYDRSFLHLSPGIAVITSIDPDHLDIYGSFENVVESFNLFVQKIKSGGSLFYRKGLEKHLSFPDQVKAFSYALDDESADYHASNMTIHKGNYYFDLIGPAGKIEGLTLGLPGRLNLENAVGAIAASLDYCRDTEKIREALAGFEGVNRRFDFQVRTDVLNYIDDYAHHPEEIRAFLEAIRELFPGRKITGVFQPHLYSRTRDFATGFAESLELLDELILLDIYPAREKPIEGVSSDLIFQQVNLIDKITCQDDKLLEILLEREFEVLVTMGAGNIDRFVPGIRELVLDRLREDFLKDN